MPQQLRRTAQVVVVGAGQAGLATAYYLRRAGLVPGEDLVLVDAADRPGGSWPRTWDGLRLFSPSSFSSLPGWMMPPWDDDARGLPPRQHVVDYLTAYEERYDLAPLRPHRVTTVEREDADPRGRLLVRAPGLELSARVVVSATGTWDQPFWPGVPGAAAFEGVQLHAADYRTPEAFAGRRVAVVGGGNSAAQVLAEVSRVTDTLWLTQRPPRYLPDDVDGRALFAVATARVRAQEGGEAGQQEHAGVRGLGDIVAVASVREARERGVLHAHPMPTRWTPTGVAWDDGREERVDVVVWCTGFRPALRHLAPLGLRDATGAVPTTGPSGLRSARDPRVFLVGYGDWTGPASATLLGVGRSVRHVADEVLQQVGGA